MFSPANVVLLIGVAGVAFFAGRISSGKPAASSGTDRPELVAAKDVPVRPARPSLPGAFETSSDPARNLKEILSLKALSRRQAGLTEFARSLAEKDLPKALELYKSLKSIHDKAAFLSGLVEAYARKSPEDCIKFLQAEPLVMLRNEGLQKALTTWAETDPAAAVAKIPEVLQGMDAHNAYLQVCTTWGEVDPQAALRWSLGQADASLSSATFEHICSSWAHTDPQAAMQFLTNNSQLTEEQRLLAARALAGTWAASDPDAALRFAMSRPESERASVTAVAFMNYAVNDPAGAAARVRQITDPDLLAAIAPEYAQLLGGSNPEQATEWINSLPAGDMRNEAVRGFVESWANSDPKAALAWALQLPPGDAGRDAGIAEAALIWDRFSPAELDAYLHTLPPPQSEAIYRIMSQRSEPDEPQPSRP
jgi:hypothetical protein